MKNPIMNFEGCRCPHCRADVSEADRPQCRECGRAFEPEQAYATRRYAGTWVLPSAIRRFGLPVLMILAGVALWDGYWLGWGFGLLMLSLFYDPFD